MILQGVLNVNKPAGISSARVVSQVKRLLPAGIKIGHAGTLDPFATGVLLLLVGKATKLCEKLMGSPKQYEATIKLGATTETLDPESPEILTEVPQPPSRHQVAQALAKFVGSIQQVPPIYSALKVGGRAAYDRARRGEQVTLEARRVEVYAIQLIEYEWPGVRTRIDCGRGTYIRSIARDVGQALGVGGYVTELRRTRVGEYYVEKSVTVEQLQSDGVEQHLRNEP